MFRAKIGDAAAPLLKSVTRGEEPQSKDVAVYKKATDWDTLSDQDRLRQRKILAHGMKGSIPPEKYGLAKQRLKRALPVSEAAAETYKEERQRGKLGADIVKLRAELVALKSQLGEELTNAKKEIQQQHLAMLTEIEAEKSRAITEVQAMVVKLSGPAPEVAKVEVGGEVFTLDKTQLSQHPGLLRAVFCDGFHARDLDKDGVYHLKVVSIAARDFHQVMRFYAGTMQPRFNIEESDHLRFVAREMGLVDMEDEVQRRTLDASEAVAQRVEAALQRLEQVTVRPEQWEYKRVEGSFSSRPNDHAADGWEPFAAAGGDIFLRRPVPPPTTAA